MSRSVASDTFIVEVERLHEVLKVVCKSKENLVNRTEESRS